MTDRIKEQLSTFLDGELPEQETALLLKRLERDDELRGALSRYSLIGAVLRNDGDVPAARQVAARVSAAIAREPLRVSAFVRLPRRDALLRSLAGLAVASGVAFGAVLIVQQVDSQDPAAPDAVLAQTSDPPIEPVSDAADAADDPARIYVTPPATDAPGRIAPAQLANYLVAHYGYATPLVRRSVGAGLMSAPDGSVLVDVAAPEGKADP
ncbi:MAG TPA: RseA family anti-sigma factor [Steroidobacteraceae bacterium]